MNRRSTGLIALAFLVFALGAVPARAQEEESPVRFGFKLGLNISDFRGNDVEGAGELLDWKAGLCAGAFMSYRVNEWFALQPELLYSMKGMKLGLLFLDAITFSLDYIEVPVLAVFNIPAGGTLKPFAYAGPVFGFNVRSEVSASLFEEEETVDVADYTNGFEFSLALGAGINFDIAGRALIFDFRYVPGLTNAFSEDFGGEGESIEWKNDTLSFLLGFAF